VRHDDEGSSKKSRKKAGKYERVDTIRKPIGAEGGEQALDPEIAVHARNVRLKTVEPQDENYEEVSFAVEFIAVEQDQLRRRLMSGGSAHP